ncbi:MAG TPA: NUDIX domain-containing protein [Ktedonobacteraceae bacterium]|nr:NUDIX domain-containing protein [Ktedonobacteraceae bacterium]
MSEDLATFLQRHTPLTEGTTIWGETIPLRVTSYLSQELPPTNLITSVRSIVLRDGDVLVVRGPEDEFYILPGGRREANETLLQTLQREILEEVGWTLTNITLLGFLHFHHLGPKPPNHPYAYPDFFQLIHAAQADQYIPEAMQEDIYVLDSSFHPVTNLQSFQLAASDQHYLQAALQTLSASD